MTIPREYRMSGQMADWPPDAVPPTPVEVAVESRWPGTIKPYRGFVDRANYDEALAQIDRYGGYIAEWTDNGTRTRPR